MPVVNNNGNINNNINNNRNFVYPRNNPKMAVVQPRILQNQIQIAPEIHQQHVQGFKNQYEASLNSSEVKDIIMSRLRHQIEQKEEFLKRPSKPLVLEPIISQPTNHDTMQFQRGFNLQQNRLKPTPEWPELKSDYAKSLESMRQQQSVSQELSDIQSSRFAIREQFFKDRNPHNSNDAYFSLPTSPYYMQDQQPNTSFIGSSSSVIEGTPPMLVNEKSDDHKHLRLIGTSPIPSQGLRIVSERKQQFESGRPLSPDGIDRTSLYKSELSRYEK